MTRKPRIVRISDSILMASWTWYLGINNGCSSRNLKSQFATSRFFIVNILTIRLFEFADRRLQVRRDGVTDGFFLQNFGEQLRLARVEILRKPLLKILHLVHRHVVEIIVLHCP